MNISARRSPAPPAAPAAAGQTRDALLRAAGRVFVEYGYRAATVRDICQRAGANVAAVNYHFRDKEGLYLEVLRHADSQARERFPDPAGGGTRGSPAERLHGFIHRLLLRLLAPGEPAWHGRLMAREMIDPTHALEVVIRERIGPLADELRAILEALAGREIPREVITRCGCSVFAQCLFYCHCQSVLVRLFPEQEYTGEHLVRLADHITAFSLAGLRQCVAAAGPPPPRRPAGRSPSHEPRPGARVGDPQRVAQRPAQQPAGRVGGPNRLRLTEPRSGRRREVKLAVAEPSRKNRKLPDGPALPPVAERHIIGSRQGIA